MDIKLVRRASRSLAGDRGAGRCRGAASAFSVIWQAAVEFACKPPRFAIMPEESYLRLFGPWVDFGRECNGILLEARDLDAPLPASDPAMSRHVKQYLEPLLAQTQVTIGEQIRRLLYGLLASRRASVDQVAERLGMNRRALHRQLAREGATFSSIFDEVRSDLALRYIEDKGLTLSEIAHLLGFSELSGFSRWFRA